MEWPIKNMEISITGWGSYRRNFPSNLPLILMDFVRQKRHWMRHAFGTCNFSLILTGQGEYRRFGHAWDVQAPCVLTQLPGEPVEYGPSGPEGAWDELFLLYEPSLVRAFEQRNLLDRERPVWPIRNLPAVLSRIAELMALSASPSPGDIADVIDRVCELLIVETHLPAPEPSDPTDIRLTIRRIERELAGDLDKDIDLGELAARHGLSLATLRRRWSEVINLSPARYRQQARLREACRLLIETTRPINEVARRVGFPDELYFSRRFHQQMRVSPRAYRKQHNAALRSASAPSPP